MFGGLRAGQIVRLRAEPTAASGDWADIEIAEPIAVSERTERRHLVVFARTDLEVQPGFSWVLAGAPLAILPKTSPGNMSAISTRPDLIKVLGNGFRMGR